MEMETQNKQTEPTAAKKKLSQTQMILIIGIIVVVAAVAVIGFMLLSKDEGGPSGTSGVLIDEKNADGFDVNQLMRDGMYEVTMNTTWSFADGKSASSDAYVANSKNNTKSVYFDLRLTEGDELLYTSPEIPTGSAIEGFVLDQELKKGSYPAYCTYHLLDDQKKEISTLSIQVDLAILK